MRRPAARGPCRSGRASISSRSCADCSHAKANGVGQRYLIQHSAGGGKSSSIAWLAHQLITLRKDDTAVFDSIITVVTDRRILDQQIRDTIKQFAMNSVPQSVTRSAQATFGRLSPRRRRSSSRRFRVPVHPQRDGGASRAKVRDRDRQRTRVGRGARRRRFRRTHGE
ncbi:MAG: hypothetical protein U0704_05710 [Candidatus Eisenbacteria bacterium]